MTRWPTRKWIPTNETAVTVKVAVLPVDYPQVILSHGELSALEEAILDQATRPLSPYLQQPRRMSEVQWALRRWTPWLSVQLLLLLLTCWGARPEPPAFLPLEPCALL
ncbi:hypothetical protein ACLKA6_014889 [Drosophila palustris]